MEEPTPQFKGKAGNNPRQKKKETSGLWQQRVLGAAGWGGWRRRRRPGSEQSWPPAHSLLNPPSRVPWALNLDGPTGAAVRFPTAPCPPGQGTDGTRDPGPGASWGGPAPEAEELRLWSPVSAPVARGCASLN